MDLANEIYLMGKNIVYNVFFQDRNPSVLTGYTISQTGKLEEVLREHMPNLPELKRCSLLEDWFTCITAMQLMLSLENPEITKAVADIDRNYVIHPEKGRHSIKKS
jgi:hypothetical protein